MKKIDQGVVDKLVDEVSRLVENPDEMRRLQMAARKSAVEEFTIERWNQGMKTTLDKAFS